MNLKNFREGLDILSRNMDNPDGYALGADHDIVYFYATDKPVSEEDFAKLRELGWFQPESPEDKYSKEEGWAAYV